VVTIYPEVEGTVQEVLVAENTSVQAGQLLLRIDRAALDLDGRVRRRKSTAYAVNLRRPFGSSRCARACWPSPKIKEISRRANCNVSASC
jgi:multidrug efflux pump subunit AcrA (membrane-fusion protein)